MSAEGAVQSVPPKKHWIQQLQSTTLKRSHYTQGLGKSSDSTTKPRMTDVHLPPQQQQLPQI